MKLRSTKDSSFMKEKATIDSDELYIGAGHLPLKQPVSPWALGATVDGGTTELAVLDFARKYLQANKLLVLRKALAAIRTDICDGKPGEPFHGEVFVDAASDDWLVASDQTFRDAPTANQSSGAHK